MGKKKQPETKFELAREAAGFTREAAESELHCSKDRIFTFEKDPRKLHPGEVVEMAKVYNAPFLCNHYCAKYCDIGTSKDFGVCELQDDKSISQVMLEVLNTLNALERNKNRMIEITVDGELSESEKPDFEKILNELKLMESSVASLKLWALQELKK